MMKNNNELDQADGLRDEVQKAESSKLPSRSELHAEKRNKKTKLKVSFPFVRLIGFLFLLIPISILAIHFNNKDSNFLDKIFSPPVNSVEQITIPKNVSVNTGGDADKKDSESVTREGQVKANVKKENDKETSSGSYRNEKTAPAETVTTNTSTNSTETVQQEAAEEEIEEAVQEEKLEYIEHIVQQSETLYRISMKYYNSRDGEKIISDYNNLVNDQVNVGQKLVIPIKR